MKVIGAGMGRTGTSSLMKGLQELGYPEVYHMTVLFKMPHHLTYWQNYGNGVDVDWRDVYDGFDAAIDWPTASAYREIAEAFPESRVILSVRDPERWYDSMIDTIYWANYDPAGNMERALRRSYDPMVDHMENVRAATSKKLVFEGWFGRRFLDRDYATKMYEQWNDEVIENIDSNRLLVWDVREGWGPLCEFLDKPVPDMEFPRSNDKAFFQERFGAKSELIKRIAEELTAEAE